MPIVIYGPDHVRLEAHWSPPGECSQTGCWIVFDRCWMYTGETFEKLEANIKTFWEHDSCIVG